MKPWDIARLVAPTTIETFFAEYWEKQPLIIRRGDASAYASLVTLDDIDRVITTFNLSHPDVMMANATRQVTPEDYTFEGGTVDIVRLYQQFASGSTIVMNQLHRFVPSLGDLVRRVEHELSSRMQTNIYLTPRESQGFRVHYDSHDVFVLQVHGVKRWKLYSAKVPLPYRGQQFNEYPVEPGEVAQEFELEPGDMLYIPRGLLHAASTTSDTSMHVTFGVLHTSWVELLIEALGRFALTDDDLRKGLPPGYARPGFDKAKAAETFRALFARAAAGADFEGALEVFVDDVTTTRAPLLQGQLQQVMRLGEITAESVAGVRPNLLYRVTDDAKGCVIASGGREVTLPAHAAETARAILASERFVVKDLPGNLDDAGKVVLVKRLVREGFVRAVL